MSPRKKARERASMILKVRSGQMTVIEAAAALGISRKTYYEWEQRGLKAMLKELEDHKPGRPPKPESPAQTALARKVVRLESKLKVAEQTAEIRAMLRAMEAAGAKKNRRR